MAAHGICFDFYYPPKPSQIWQNGSTSAADTHLAVKHKYLINGMISTRLQPFMIFKAIYYIAGLWKIIQKSS